MPLGQELPISATQFRGNENEDDCSPINLSLIDIFREKKKKKKKKEKRKCNVKMKDGLLRRDEYVSKATELVRAEFTQLGELDAISRSNRSRYLDGRD